MAEYKTSRNTERTWLYKVVPRKVPFTVGISPCDLCNFKCSYCHWSTPNGAKDAKMLSWESFVEIINQFEDMLSETDEDVKVLNLDGIGEPLLNSRIVDMVRECKSRKLAQRIQITTNGSRLTHEVSDGLIDAGLDRLLVSIQGTNAQKYKDVCGYNIDFEKLIDELRYFHEKSGDTTLYVKIIDVALDDEEDKQRFLDIFSPICDEIYVETVMNSCPDVDYDELSSENIGILTRDGTSITEMQCCNALFTYMNIYSNGNVNPCGCLYPPLYIGNVFEKPMKEIWNGKKHKEIMLLHASGRRKEIDKCRICDSIKEYTGFPEDNLDEHLEEIKARIEVL